MQLGKHVDFHDMHTPEPFKRIVTLVISHQIKKTTYSISQMSNSFTLINIAVKEVEVVSSGIP